jgi:hypothetical protein
MAPQIGQRTTLNGKPVVWSGTDHGWQSPQTHAKMRKEGAFKFGAQEIRRAGNALNAFVNRHIPKPAREAVARYAAGVAASAPPSKHDVANKALGTNYFKDRTADDIKAISDKTNVDPRLIKAAVAAAQSTVNAKAGANTLRVFPQANKVAALKGGIKAAQNRNNFYGGLPFGAPQTPAQTGRGRILGQPGTTGTGRTPGGQPIKGVPPREPSAARGNATPRNVRLQGGDVVRTKPAGNAQIIRAGSGTTKPARVQPTGLGDPLATERTRTSSGSTPRPAAKPERTNSARPVGQVATDRSSAKARRLRDWREQQRKGRAIVHGDNANGFGEPSTQTRNGIAGPSDLHGPYTRGYTTTVGNRRNNDQVAVFDGTRGPIGKGKGFATPPNKEVVRGTIQTPQQRIRNATPVQRPGRRTARQDQQLLRSERVKSQLREISAKRQGKDGINIKPSRGGDGKRIVYEGGPLNVQQENRYDPRGSRYRGRDTSEPRRTAAAMHEGEKVSNDDIKDYSRESGYNPGFSKTSKKKGVSGDAGSAANSAGGIRQQLIREFQATKAGGAVISSSRSNPGEILRMGTKKPSEDWLVPRIQERLLEHRARVDAASGRRSPDSIQPGARRRGAAARLTEEQKRSGVANTTTYGGSVPQVPRPVTIRQQVPKLGNAKTARAVNETGNLRSRVKRANTDRIAQIEKRRQARNKAQGRQGPTTDAKGKTVSDQVRDKLKETKDRAQRAKLRNQRDPQLTADTNARNAGVRSTRSTTRGVTHSKPMSRKKAEATATALEQRFGQSFGISRQPNGRYVVNFTGRQLSGKNNTRVAGRNSRPVGVRPEADPVDQNPSIRYSRKPGTQKEIYDRIKRGEDVRTGIIKPEPRTPTVGTAARRGQRVRFDSRTEQFIHSTNLAEVKVTPAKGVKPHRAGNKEYMRVETQRRILEARIRNTKDRTKKAELKAQLAQLKPPTKAATDKALAQVDLQQRTRTTAGDARGAGPFRAHNEKVRAETKPRRSHIRDHRLPPEEIKNPSPPMPNIAEDGAVNSRGSFKTGGELKGVTQRGRTNAKGRSTKSNKKAAALLQKVRDRRINEQKAPKVKPNSKRKRDVAMRRIRELRNRRAAGR